MDESQRELPALMFDDLGKMFSQQAKFLAISMEIWSTPKFVDNITQLHEPIYSSRVKIKRSKLLPVKKN